jgi:hypothetical protein
VTQREAVLKALRKHPKRGLCIADLPLELGYCARNRVSELRRDGWQIVSETCRVHKHGGPIARYRLVTK